MSTIKSFFYPESICVAGASTKEKSIGYEILQTIKNYGYTGNVYPVNPKADTILGYKCYHNIEEIENVVELAIIVVPKQFAEETVDLLLKKNVKSIVLITAGFKEIGKEGEELEKRIVEKIKSSGARMVGPNCMGVINTLNEIKLNATFVAENPETGSIGFLSQSGALGAAVLNSLRETDIKFAHFISVGNKADINENDILKYWQSDNNINTCTLYLESFENGKEFIAPVISGEVNKPIIVLKAGKTESGMKAASSHTGALSGKDKVADAVLKQFGIIRAENLNELFNTAKGFENFPVPKGNRIAVITNAGGPAILCVDKIEKEGLKLAQFSSETKSKLRSIVHPEGSVENPVDLLPGGTAEIFKQVNETIIADVNVDAVISIFVEPVMVSPFEVIENVYSIKTDKPILQTAMPLPEFWAKYKKDSSNKLPVFRNPEDSAEVLSNMLLYSGTQKKLNQNKSEYELTSKIKNKQIFSESGFLGNEAVAGLLNKYNLPLINELVIKPNDIENLDIDLYPVVLKGTNKDVVHKSELSAVKLNIINKTELLLAAKEMKDNLLNRGFEIEKYLIQEYVEAKYELLIGGFRDPSFGPVIMFGSGGKYVEVFDDIAIRSCIISDYDIDEMINYTKAGQILKGVRGEKSCDIKELKRIIKTCAKLMIDNDSIIEFDLNPLIIDKKNDFYIVDARIKNRSL